MPRCFSATKRVTDVPVHVRTAPFRDQKGLILGIAESFDEGTCRLRKPRPAGSILRLTDVWMRSPGVMNQALTRSYLREHLAFFTEYDLPFGILSIRIEELERFRTAHGREAGDDILHVVAETMKRALGTAGFLGRWTEDEFVAIVPNCTGAELNRAGESIRTSVNSSEIQWWGDLLSVTVSVGRAMVQRDDKIESLLKRAENGAGRLRCMDDRRRSVHKS